MRRSRRSGCLVHAILAALLQPNAASVVDGDQGVGGKEMTALPAGGDATSRVAAGVAERSYHGSRRPGHQARSRFALLPLSRQQHRVKLAAPLRRRRDRTDPSRPPEWCTRRCCCRICSRLTLPAAIEVHLQRHAQYRSLPASDALMVSTPCQSVTGSGGRLMVYARSPTETLVVHHLAGNWRRTVVSTPAETA